MLLWEFLSTLNLSEMFKWLKLLERVCVCSTVQKQTTALPSLSVPFGWAHVISVCFQRIPLLRGLFCSFRCLAAVSCHFFPEGPPRSEALIDILLFVSVCLIAALPYVSTCSPHSFFAPWPHTLFLMYRLYSSDAIGCLFQSHWLWHCGY